MNATQPEQGSQPNQSTTSINNSSMNITIANGISNIAIDKYLRIATHNVQGLTCNIKFQIFLEHCIKSELHIIAMMETKLKNQNTIALSNPLYKIYTSNHIPTKSAPQEASLGTAIAVLPQLQPYIHNIQTCPGTAICIDFFFPANTKLRIISTYLPSNHLSLKRSTHKQISNWVLEARAKKWNTIVLGDFNEDLNRVPRRDSILHILSSSSLSSLLNFHSVTTPTWSRGTSHSQIDDIWINTEQILALEAPTLTDPTGITESDHLIISTTWSTRINLEKRRIKKKKRKVYLFNQMTTEKWESFNEKIEKGMQENRNTTKYNIQDQPTLNKYWNSLVNIILTAAKDSIPIAYTGPRIFYAHSLEATKLHMALKSINGTINLLKNTSIPTSLEFLTHKLNEKIKEASRRLPEPLAILNRNEAHLLGKTLKTLQDSAREVRHLRRTEAEQAQRIKIQYHIEQRYRNMEQNTSRMIDSILKRHSDRISFEKIITPEAVITNPQEIKRAVKEHFQN